MELPRNCGVWIVGGFLRDVVKIVWGIELDFTNPFFLDLGFDFGDATNGHATMNGYSGLNHVIECLQAEGGGLI